MSTPNGENATRSTGASAHGTEGVHSSTRGEVVTSRWLDPSHGGLDLGFPQNV